MDSLISSLFAQMNLQPLFILIVCLLSACGSGEQSPIEERPPRICADSSSFQQYLTVTPADDTATIDSAGFAGKIVWMDRSERFNTAVVQTHEGSNWTVRPRLYLAMDDGTKTEVALSLPFPSNPKIVSRDEAPNILLESGVSPPERSLFLYDPVLKRAEMISHGHRVRVSPDLKMAAFLRSNGKGFHNVCLMDLNTLKIDVAFSLWESDPESGISFDYFWAPDSAVLVVEGTSRGFRMKKNRQVEDFRILYNPKEFCAYITE